MEAAEKQTRYWQVDFTKKAQKQIARLPDAVRDTVYLLKGELELEGPLQPEWPNFGKLHNKKKDYYHCHLNKGHPTYVVVWLVEDNKMHLIDVIFAGTHENVNYDNYKWGIVHASRYDAPAGASR